MNLKNAPIKSVVLVVAVIALSLLYSLMTNGGNGALKNVKNVSADGSTTVSSTSNVSLVGSTDKPVSMSSATIAKKTDHPKFVGPLLYQNSGVRATYQQVQQGQTLFDESCSSCHGAYASGTDRAPNLVGLGPATIQFWVSTGRMPLSNPIIQPIRKPVKFTQAQILDIVSFVASQAPGGVLIPNIKGVSSATLAEGASLFDINCAGCHTITGAGDALASGAYAPSLHQATPEQVAEAIRTGPANMPRFNPGVLTNAQVNSLVKYVTQGIQHPDNAGGWNLGGVGPVAEGFIGLLIGVGLLVLAAFWVGDRK